MLPVTLTRDNLVLDKLIKIYLTDEDIPVNEKVVYTLKDYILAFNRRDTIINTTILEPLQDNAMFEGYDIEVISEGKHIKFSDMLNGNTNNCFGRDLKLCHDFHKLLVAGGFDIKVEWFDN